MGTRLYIAAERLTGARVTLTDDEVGYLTRVRRLSRGAAVEVFDGKGGLVVAELLGRELALGARTAQAKAKARRFALELWQGLAKGEKLELVVQKATELGVARIVPFASARAVVKLGAERGEKRVERLGKIAAEAARQCGRADVPEIAAPARFADFAAREGATRIVLYELATGEPLWPRLMEVAPGATVALAVGPEGGFAAEEIAAAAAAGAAVAGLGELTLRTETAAIAACALAMAAATC